MESGVGVDVQGVDRIVGMMKMTLYEGKINGGWVD
jgi:hypothetical protein